MCTLWFLKECEFRYGDSFNDVIQYTYNRLGFTDEQIEWLENKIYFYKIKKHVINTCFKIQMEAPVGFEPTIRVLQTHALPLG